MCVYTVHRRVWDGHDGARVRLHPVRRDRAPHEWCRCCETALVHSCTDPRGKPSPAGSAIVYNNTIWATLPARTCLQYQSRAHLISNEPPRGRLGQNSKPTSADSPHLRSITSAHSHCSTSGQGARTLGWLRVRWTFGIGGAPRDAGLHLGSPGAARGRLRYARLSLSPNLSWWSEAVLAGDLRSHSRAGSCMDIPNASGM